MKSKIYEFDPVVYPWRILVTKNFDPEELDELFYVVNTNNELEEPGNNFHPAGNCIARTLFVVSKNKYLRYIICLLVRPKEIGTGTMAHEAYHAANMFAEQLGFLPDKFEYDEPEAYLIQWIANCIDSVMRNKANVLKGEIWMGLQT